jgi:hypothetical protein
MLPKPSKTEKKTKIRTTSKVKDYGNDPFFVEQSKKSKEFLEKNGFPEELLKKK